MIDYNNQRNVDYPTHIKWREDVQHNVVGVERGPGYEEDDTGRDQNAVGLLSASQLAGEAGIVNGGGDGCRAQRLTDSKISY